MNDFFHFIKNNLANGILLGILLVVEIFFTGYLLNQLLNFQIYNSIVILFAMGILPVAIKLVCSLCDWINL